MAKEVKHKEKLRTNIKNRNKKICAGIIERRQKGYIFNSRFLKCAANDTFVFLKCCIIIFDSYVCLTDGIFLSNIFVGIGVAITL